MKKILLLTILTIVAVEGFGQPAQYYIRPTGGNYANLQDAINALPATLTGPVEFIYDTAWDVASATQGDVSVLVNKATSKANYLAIRCVGVARAGATWSDTKPIFNDDEWPINYLKMEGCQLISNDTFDTKFVGESDSGTYGHFEFTDCYFNRVPTWGDTNYGMNFPSTPVFSKEVSVVVANCIFMGNCISTQVGSYVSGANVYLYAYHNTFVSPFWTSDQAFRVITLFRGERNFVQAGDSTFASVTTKSADYNFYIDRTFSDGTGDDDDGANSVWDIDETAYFTSWGGYDLSLKPGTAAVDIAGTISDATLQSLNVFGSDISGASRTADHDAGALEYFTPTPSPTPTASPTPTLWPKVVLSYDGQWLDPSLESGKFYNFDVDLIKPTQTPVAAYRYMWYVEGSPYATPVLASYGRSFNYAFPESGAHKVRVVMAQWSGTPTPIATAEMSVQVVGDTSTDGGIVLPSGPYTTMPGIVVVPTAMQGSAVKTMEVVVHGVGGYSQTVVSSSATLNATEPITINLNEVPAGEWITAATFKTSGSFTSVTKEWKHKGWIGEPTGPLRVDHRGNTYLKNKTTGVYDPKIIIGVFARGATLTQLQDYQDKADLVVNSIYSSYADISDYISAASDYGLYAVVPNIAYGLSGLTSGTYKQNYDINSVTPNVISIKGDTNYENVVAWGLYDEPNLTPAGGGTRDWGRTPQILGVNKMFERFDSSRLLYINYGQSRFFSVYETIASSTQSNNWVKGLSAIYSTYPGYDFGNVRRPVMNSAWTSGDYYIWAWRDEIQAAFRRFEEGTYGAWLRSINNMYKYNYDLGLVSTFFERSKALDDGEEPGPAINELRMMLWRYLISTKFKGIVMIFPYHELPAAGGFDADFDALYEGFYADVAAVEDLFVQDDTGLTLTWDSNTKADPVYGYVKEATDVINIAIGRGYDDSMAATGYIEFVTTTGSISRTFTIRDNDGNPLNISGTATDVLAPTRSISISNGASTIEFAQEDPIRVFQLSTAATPTPVPEERNIGPLYQKMRRSKQAKGDKEDVPYYSNVLVASTPNDGWEWRPTPTPSYGYNSASRPIRE